MMVVTLIGLASVRPTHAQESFTPADASGRMIALSTAGGTLSIAETTDIPLPSGTIDVDWHPLDPTRWARVNDVGIPHFVPETGIEGVYTAAPFFDGFQVDQQAANKLFVREIEWSPNGQMLAFRIRNEALPDLNQGVWFWQPLRDLPTDPSYQIMRHCPPFCTLVNTPEGSAGWRAISLGWSSDNNAILVGLILRDSNRRALDIRYATREVEQVQASTPPAPLRYSYGHWTNDGQRIVVSGRDPDGQMMYGIINRDGTEVTRTDASNVGMVAVRDAIQSADGSLLLLASAEGATSPHQIITGAGDVLTVPIGNAAPTEVTWSPDRTAVYVRTATSAYVAQVDGTIYDITATIQNSPNVGWVNGALPATLTPLPLPPAVATAPDLAEATTTRPALDLSVGSLLVLAEGTLDIYADPVADAIIVGTISADDELIITGGPLGDGTDTWYRVQTLDYTGWIRTTDQLAPAE